MEVEKGKKKRKDTWAQKRKNSGSNVSTSENIAGVFEWYRDCGRNIQPSPNNGSSGDCVFKIVKILY